MIPGEVKDHVIISKESVSAPNYSLGLMWSHLLLSSKGLCNRFNTPKFHETKFELKTIFQSDITTILSQFLVGKTLNTPIYSLFLFLSISFFCTEHHLKRQTGSQCTSLFKPYWETHFKEKYQNHPKPHTKYNGMQLINLSREKQTLLFWWAF